jgi:6-phosphogluconate dehydrogenase
MEPTVSESKADIGYVGLAAMGENLILNMESKGVLYIGTGVSGGEEGALLGPSIMPGGSPAAWDSVKPIFQKIAAHTDTGEPCCDWVGENGAGHFVKMVHDGIDNDPHLDDLLLDPLFRDAVVNAHAAWRRVVIKAVELGFPMPAISSALVYSDGYRSEHLPANLLQAQRDYFGAHICERIDRKRGEFFHTNWTGRGGTTSASAYVA